MLVLGHDELFEHEVKNDEGRVTRNGTMMVDTGKFTGRSPKDKYFVRQLPSSEDIAWGNINKPVAPEIFDELYAEVIDYLSGKDVYVLDGYCGANADTRAGDRRGQRPRRPQERTGTPGRERPRRDRPDRRNYGDRGGPRSRDPRVITVESKMEYEESKGHKGELRSLSSLRGLLARQPEKRAQPPAAPATPAARCGS